MVDEEPIFYQSRKGEMKAVIEFVNKSPPKAVVELKEVNTSAHKDDKLFTYKEYCKETNLRSPPEEQAVETKEYGNFDFLYRENPADIKKVVVLYNHPRRADDGRMNQLPVVTGSTVAYGSYEFLYGEHQGAIKSTPLEPLLLKNESVDSAYENIGGDYYANDKGYYHLNKKDDYVQMTDFKVRVIERRVSSNVNGTTNDEIVFRLFDDSGWEYTTTIEYDKWASHLIGLIRSKVPTRILNLTELNLSHFEQLMAYVLKNSEFPTNYFVSHWGWGDRDSNLGRKFWHGGLKGCKTPKMLLPPIEDRIRRARLLREAFSFTEIAPRGVASVLVIYSCAAYTDAIFTDAGYFLSHGLMLIGSSGMLKTATVREVFNVFVSVNDRLTTVRSTEASLHVMTERAFDDTLVIDDFNREGSKQEVAQKTKNIQTLIRSYSDKSPRVKYGGNDDVKKYSIRGGLVITGETNMTGELKSGKLRYIKIPIEERFNGELLKKYQNNPKIMKFFFSEYIRFLEENYLKLVNFVSSNFDEYRIRFSELKEPRIIDAEVHLLMTAQIILEFLTENGVLTEMEGNCWLTDFERNLRELLRNQSEEVETTAPHILYVKQVWELLTSGAIELAPNVDCYKSDLKRYIGYVDGDLFMFKKDDLYRAVLNAYKNKDEYLTMGFDEVLKVLKDKGVSECNKGSNLRKASAKLSEPNKGIGRPLMLALRKHICEKIIESEN